MNILSLIKSRRSIRRFRDKKIPPRLLRKVLEAGQWAPSGLNNQPWRFMVVQGDEKKALAFYTQYSAVIQNASHCVLIFLDTKNSYHREKDLMAIGACVQNMLLCSQGLGLGSCWLGEILNKRKLLQKKWKLAKHLELAAVIALGWPLGKKGQGIRKRLEKLMVKRSVEKSKVKRKKAKKER